MTEMEDPKEEMVSLETLAADACKAAMLGDQAAMLRLLDAHPQLVNHPDEQVQSFIPTWACKLRACRMLALSDTQLL